VLDTGLVPLVAKFADVLQIGARNMQNFALLHAVGSSQHPVLLKRFETYTRNTFDVNAIPVLKSLTHLPVIADPSHAVGKWEYVEAVARSAVAAGADGLIVEVHMHPDKALSDGRQSLTPERFAALVQQAKRIAEAVDRSV
jgi:3-deoxy-7-phosphoheptulonate synthase